MLIKNLTVGGLLSFGHPGIIINLTDLNVLIGPNGSGKSNLLELIALLQASPQDLKRHLNRSNNWVWLGKDSTSEGTVEVTVEGPSGSGNMSHRLQLSIQDGQTAVNAESILTNLSGPGPSIGNLAYQYHDGTGTIKSSDGMEEGLRNYDIDRTESILSQLKDPVGRYPAIKHLQSSYGQIRLYRDWQFGPSAGVRGWQPIDLRADQLNYDAGNLALVVSNLDGGLRSAFVEHLRELIPGIVGVQTKINHPTIQVFLDEGNGRSLPASRLSDGTLRYLSLLAILLNPSPPAFVAIEEPELGLHPDVLPHLGKLIKDASSRMQLIITTHSQVLLDSFSESPGDVVVCSRGPQGSVFQRLSAEKLEIWLKDHTLGELWNMGEIGGNRW